MIPCAYPSQQPKVRYLDRFSRFCIAHCRVSLYFTMGRPFLSKLSLPMGICNSCNTYGSLGSPESSTQTASRSLQSFYRAHYCDRPTDTPRNAEFPGSWIQLIISKFNRFLFLCKSLYSFEKNGNFPQLFSQFNPAVDKAIEAKT